VTGVGGEARLWLSEVRSRQNNKCGMPRGKRMTILPLYLCSDSRKEIQ